MANKKIPNAVKTEVTQIIEDYNAQNHPPYAVSFRGSYAYLDRMDYNNSFTKIGRLRYNYETGKWDFAVFKYSNERYDPKEWLFPGSELLDGTIEGAMRAGLEIYPLPLENISFKFWGCLLSAVLLPISLLINFVRSVIGLFKKLFKF